MDRQKTQGNETQDSTIEQMASVVAEEAEIAACRYRMLKKYKVTGSRIRANRITEGTSPLTIWTKEDLDNSGYLSLSEFLKNTSLSNFGVLTLIHIVEAP